MVSAALSIAVPLSRAMPLPYSTPLTVENHSSQYLRKKVPTSMAYSTQSLTIVCHVVGQTGCTSKKDVLYDHIDLEDSYSGTSASHFFGLEHRHQQFSAP